MVNICCRNKQFNNIEAIIFDKDGTLEDSSNFLRELAHKRSRLIDAQIPGIGDPLLMAFGVDGDRLDPTGLMAVGSRPENQIAAAAYIAETGRGWHESLEIARLAFEEASQYLQRNPQTSPPFPGSIEAIVKLAETDLKLAILSSASTASIKSFLEYTELSTYFDFIKGVEPNSATKPDPHLFWDSCKSLAIAPENALMVGDSAVDFEMARRANAGGSVGICWGNANSPSLEKADVAISHLNEITVQGN